MINQIEASLRAWCPDGRAALPESFVRSLRCDPGAYEVTGGGEPGQAVRVILLQAEFDRSRGIEPAELFFRTVMQRLEAAASWLTLIKAEDFRLLRRDGLTVDVLFEFWIDQNQFDFQLPYSFLGELGRLELPITFVSND